MLDASLRSFWKPHAGWQLQPVQNFLPAHVLVKRNHIGLSEDEGLWDIPVCSFTKTGKFTTASVCRSLNEEPGIDASFNWLSIWKFCGPQQPSLTFWFGLHEAFITNELLWKRRIIESPRCDVCGYPIQGVFHVLLDCSIAQAV